MRRNCLLLAIAALCGCGARHYRTPIVPMDSTPPTRDPAPTATERNDSPTLPPANSNLPAHRDDAEAAPSAESARPDLSEAVTTVNGQQEDVYFAYDQFDLSPEASATLGRDAELLRKILRDFPQLRIAVEGHCDERGSAEYNLGLGDRRASRAIADLAQLGLPAANFAPVSYGKEAPQCTESTERCWSRNRRAHFVVRVNATN